MEKKKQQEEELKKKQEEKDRRKDERNKKRVRSKSDQNQSAAKRPSPEQPEGHIDSSSHSSTGTGQEAARRTKRSTESADNEIDINRCCDCFGMYTDDIGTGQEWLRCKCTRWIHEECIDDDNVNIKSSKLCPLC